MPTGPSGEKRPHSVTANAVHVAKVATREIEEIYDPKSNGVSPPRKGRKIVLNLAQPRTDDSRDHDAEQRA